MRLGQFLDATARAKQFVTAKKDDNTHVPSAIQIFHETTESRLSAPQSEYPLRVGKSAVPVVVPVMPKLTPEVLEDRDDEGGGVDSEGGMVDEDELVSVWQFAPRTRESKKAMQVKVAFVKTLWERIPLQFPAEAETGGSAVEMQREKVCVSLPRWRWTDSGNP